MSVPKSRHTKSKRNRRRSHILLQAPVLGSCPKCGKPVLPHVLCSNCGSYRGKEIVNILEKLERKERKKREKEIKAKEKAEAGAEKPLDLQELSKK